MAKTITKSTNLNASLQLNLRDETKIYIVFTKTITKGI